MGSRCHAVAFLTDVVVVLLVFLSTVKHVKARDGMPKNGLTTVFLRDLSYIAINLSFHISQKLIVVKDLFDRRHNPLNRLDIVSRCFENKKIIVVKQNL